MAVLPPSMILNSSEKAAVRQHVAGLEHLLEADQPFEIRGQLLSAAQAHATMIAALLIKGGGQKLDERSSEALTEDYLDAIEDLPAWSVREALRKWNRGESPKLDGKAHDFNWRPTPPTLRRLAQLEVAAIKGRIISLQKVLNAVPLIEYSAEHCATMRERLRDAIRGIADKTTVSPPPEQQQEDAA